MLQNHGAPPGPQVTEAAVTLGEYLREERGRCGVRAYMALLGELAPREWTEQIARRLNAPCVPGERPPMPPMPSVPHPEPRQKKQPDMEKILQLMQIMSRS